MMSKRDSAIYLLNAYGTFLEETNTHVREARRLIIGAVELSGEELKDLAMRFHKVRGGAGFFQLDELREVARTLEELLKGGVDERRTDPVALSDLVQRIELVVASLPAPPSARGR